MVLELGPVGQYFDLTTESVHQADPESG
jgi:hypothetical protein